MAYQAGTPIREAQEGRKVTTVHIDHQNYLELMHKLKDRRYNFSHFMDNMVSIVLKDDQILDIILEGEK